jgi:hypothetical protein
MAVPVILVLCLFVIDVVRCAHNYYGDLSTGTSPCNETTPCVNQTKLDSFIVLPDLGFGETGDGLDTVQTAAGFDQNEACPATELSDSGIDHHLVANQASFKMLYATHSPQI